MREGPSPREVGDQVLSSIQEGRFYILTHPDWNYLIEQRVATILEGRNPERIIPPGFESLLEKLAKLAE
jgi:hypothetical protein